MLRERQRVWDFDHWLENEIVEWWDRDDFRGRVTRHTTIEKLGGPEKLVSVIPIPDTTIICDFCSVDIEDFPCPVWHGYALCREHQKKCRIEEPSSIEDGRRETC